MMQPRLLVVEDEPTMRIALSDALRAEGYTVAEAADGVEGLHHMQEEHFDMLITDLRLPRVDGLQLLTKTREMQPDCGVVLITAYATVETAVEAIKQGAYDYLTKPFDMEEFLIIVKRFLDHRRLAAEYDRLRQEVEGRRGFCGIIGTSPPMRKLFSLIDQVAKTDATVLIQGENGTGKELVAKAIHATSQRKEGPLVTISCAAIPEYLLEAEFFGYEKGAFTGAIQRKPGHFELADGGTLFLDEIGEIPLHLQAKFLRVIQERSLLHIGGRTPISLDVRILCATQKDLHAEVSAGRFREDLFYRINVVSMHVPPLRERRSDIPLLIECFLEKHRQNMEQELSIIPATMDRLLCHAYPGNVRELENAIERAMILCRGGEIQPSHLPEEIGKDMALSACFSPPFPFEPSLADSLQRCEKFFIAQALDMTAGKKGKAAEILGISRKHLWDKIRQYGL
jgi:DNA-binding NtrC family response regulator